MGTAIKHPVLDWPVKPSLVIFDIRALWRSALSVRVPRMSNATLGIKWLTAFSATDYTVI